MEDSFRHFFEQLPDKNISGVELHGTSDIIVMRPSSFVLVEVFIPDYHFAIPPVSPATIINGKEYQCGRGRMISFAPGSVVRAANEVPTRPYLALSIKKDFFNSIARSASGRTESPSLRYDNPYSPAVISHIRELEEEIVNFGYNCPLMLQSIGTQIAIQLLRVSGNPVSDKVKKLDKNYVELAREYIMTYYNSNIGIDDICRQINISPYHFIRMFKEKTGVTPHEFLQFVRIGKAEEMLKSGSYTVGEVAGLCGFVSPDHFSRIFKRIKGATPSEYRKSFNIFQLS